MKVVQCNNKHFYDADRFKTCPHCNVNTSNETKAPVSNAPMNGTPINRAPVNNTPMNGAPINRAPVNNTPMNGAPINRAPANNTPMNGAPINRAPVNNTPINGAPINRAPVNNTPMNGALINRAPVNNTPINGAPINRAPVNNTPMNGAPINRAPVNNTPMNGAPINRAPVNNTPMNGAPINRAPVNNTPMNGAPVNRAPVNNTPMNGAPINRAPVNEIPVKKKEAEIQKRESAALVNIEPQYSKITNDSIEDKTWGVYNNIGVMPSGFQGFGQKIDDEKEEKEEKAEPKISEIKQETPKVEETDIKSEVEQPKIDEVVKVQIEPQPISEVTHVQTSPLQQSKQSDKTIAFYNTNSVEPVTGWIVCTKGESVGTSYNLKTGKNTIGRSIEMNVALTEEISVSREKHAIITFDPKNVKFYVQPGETDNLSYLNNEILMTVSELKAFDKLQFGNAEFVFVPLCSKKFNWDNYVDC